MDFELEQQTAEIEHQKLQIEAKRLTLEKKKVRKKLEVDTKQGTKPNAVKLPKIDFKKFIGGILNWQEFWDSFKSAIHSNPSPSPIEKNELSESPARRRCCRCYLRTIPD